jgi:hypothetical protein
LVCAPRVSGFKKGDSESTLTNSRAWCFQEHYLSRRIPRFGKSRDSFWDARKAFHSECVFSFVGLLKMAEAAGTAHTVAKCGGLGHWLVMILGKELYASIYSRRDLSVPSDRLEALSGSARHFQSGMCGVEYRAGHWNEGGGLALSPRHQVEYLSPRPFLDLGACPPPPRRGNIYSDESGTNSKYHPEKNPAFSARKCTLRRMTRRERWCSAATS